MLRDFFAALKITSIATRIWIDLALLISELVCFFSNSRYSLRSDSLYRVTIQAAERGKFGDLAMKAVIAIDLSQPNIALTKKTGGLFNWTDRTLSQLKKCLSNDKTLQQKQIRLVISIFSLLFYLMQDEDVNISKGCVLKTFMGSTYNLLTSRSD